MDEGRQAHQGHYFFYLILCGVMGEPNGSKITPQQPPCHRQSITKTIRTITEEFFAIYKNGYGEKVCLGV